MSATTTRQAITAVRTTSDNGGAESWGAAMAWNSNLAQLFLKRERIPLRVQLPMSPLLIKKASPGRACSNHLCLRRFKNHILRRQCERRQCEREGRFRYGTQFGSR